MKYLLITSFLLFSILLSGQTGGEHVFPFLDLDFNARNSALGRHYIADNENDVNIAVFNPSLLNEEMHNNIGFNQALLAGGINQGMVAYARNLLGGRDD